MDKDAVYSTLDYTLLKQFADKASIDALCKKALEYKTASVCIPPSYVPTVFYGIIFFHSPHPLL